MTDPGCPREMRTVRVPDTRKNFSSCPCFKCPTHNGCMKENKEKLFCSRSVTRCDLVRVGCICGECQVASRYLLSGNYYCGEGAAKF